MKSQRKTADLFISDNLRSVLSRFKTQSEVANLLLKKRINKDELVTDHVNYLCISTADNSKISYLTDERRKNLSEDDYWTSSRRFQAKPGAFISKIFKNISAKEVEKFSTLFKAETTKLDFKFEVVSGQAIKDYYHYDSYASNEKGSLGISCMKHENTQKLLNLYRDNPNQISLLIMLDNDNLLLGRALLWNFDKHKIMDRIYTINDETYAYSFKKWATENGYFYKSEQNWYNTIKFEQLNKPSVELKLKVGLDNREFRYYPYMDTFKFIDVNGYLYNYHPEGTEFYTISSCDGLKLDSDYLRFDGVDRVFRYHSECVWVKYLKIHTKESNVRWSSVNDCYILKDHSLYDGDLADYIFVEEYNALNNWDRINKFKKSDSSSAQATINPETNGIITAIQNDCMFTLWSDSIRNNHVHTYERAASLYNTILENISTSEPSF